MLYSSKFQRNLEFEQKMNHTVEFVLGDRVKEMFRISILATDNRNQNRHLDDKLLAAVISLVRSLLSERDTQVDRANRPML